MEYTINNLSKMSGVSTRMLRHYDKINLLKPSRVAESRYRFYGQEQVDILQQILFYRELDFSLEEIKALLSASDFDRGNAFISHLFMLQNKRERLDTLILNVTKSITAMKGEISMSNQEKFEGFKQSLIDENEQQYGEEIRAKYGDTAIDESNANLKGLTQEQYDESERLRTLFEQAIIAALEIGDPAGELAQNACDLHRRWLMVFYPAYSKEYHMGLAEMYIADERFKAHYEKLAVGCTEFLHKAISVYCKN
ncbi:MAG: MerR family transcriptional regulator [Oscillospiraceae bacterium]|nr:MerR family transcriptional regulator [Oscillospiraceae bacterium]